MPQWKELEKEICNWLRSFECSQISFRGPNQAIIGFPSDGFRSDGMVTDGEVLIAIEVEAGQMHPDTNVGKYWLLNNQYKAYKKVILFHVYTPEYNSYGWRKQLGEFYAVKMSAEMPFDYVLMDYRKAADFSATASEIKTLIKDRLKEALPTVFQ